MNKRFILLVLMGVLIGLVLISFASAYLPVSSDSPQDEWWAQGRDSGFSRYTNANAPLNISNTTVRTSSDLLQDIDSGVVVAGDSVFVIPDSTYSGRAYELNASNVSQMLANSTNTYTIAYMSSPTYYRGSLFFHSDSPYLYQLNASNLSRILKAYDITGSDGGYYAFPIVFNRAVYVGDGNYVPYFRQLNASNISQAIASYYYGGRIYESSPIANGYLYGGGSGGILQLNASNISQLISSVSCAANSIEGSFLASSNFVYKGCTISSVNTLVQFNATNLSQQIATFPKSAWGYAFGNGFIYFGSGSTVYQLNASNVSQQIANFTLATSASTIPAVNNNSLFISAGNVMYQLDALNVSNLIGSYTAGSAINGNPVIAKGFLYFGSVNNKVYQLGVYNPLPAIRVDYPSDEQVYENVTQLNYTLVQNSSHVWDSCWYSSDYGTTNSTLVSPGTNFANITSAQGWNNLTVYCNDSSNNLYNSSLNYYVDTDIPIFTNATNKTVNQTTALSHQITATDVGGVNCFSVNDTTNFAISCSGLLTNNTFLAVGNYSLNISVYDYANHYNYTSVVVSVLDSVAPLLAIVSPANNTSTSDNGLDINYSVFDVGTAVSTCWYSNDSFSVNYTLPGCANITDVTWSDGVHNLRLWANDTSGNRNLTTSRFTVDTAPPVFNNLTNQNVTQGNNFAYQLNASDSTLSVSCFSVNDTVNFNITCGGYLTNKTALAVGVYSLNITVNDSVNNRNSTILLVNVDTRPIIGLSLISPTGDINVTQNRTFDVMVNVSCSAANCGAVNVTLDPISYGTQYNFSVCGATGASGPTQANCNTNYTGTSLAGLVNVTNGIQNWTVPMTGVYTIEVAGAKGGGSYPGNGSKMIGTFSLTAGTVLQILVGQIGPTSTYGGGGGGSFVSNGSNYFVATPMIVAGGGGGGSGSTGSYYIGINATTITNGTNGQGESANKGTNGGGGIKGSTSFGGGGGGGFSGNGTSGSYGTGGKGFIYGGAGSTSSYGNGGFGGGGGNGYWGGGGGGGYSGGGGGNYDLYGGGGGGSYNIGSSQTNSSGTNAGNGYVVITYVGGKGGTVSMNTSAIPFYTTTQNPYNLTLNDGQSQIITWSVNATGSIDNTYLFYVYANRISDMGIGNTTSSWNVTITNDTGAVPTISIIYPVNGANYSSDVTDLNYSVSGNNLSRCWYSINNGVTNSSDVQNGTNFIGLTSNEGSNTWYVYCNNTNGNISSSSVTFNKDTGYPSLSNYWDNNGTITSSGVALFNATVLNTNGTVWLSINGTNYSATNNSNIYNVSVSLTTGSYDYIWYAYGNGTSRNLNNSVSRTYVVLADSSIPQVGFVLPTPANGINSTNRYFEVNTSIFESSLNSVVYNWNGTNYTMYNSSLVLMMNFNNISSLGENSTKVLDFSRYQNNATLNGAALNSSGKYGGAVSFNGSANVYGRVQNSSSLNFTTFTVSAWINAASWKTNYWEGSIVNRDSLLVPAGFFLRTGASGTLSFGIGNTSGSWPETKSGAIMSSNRWYYVSGVYNGSSISIYINGSFVNSTAASNYNNTNAPIYIGNGYDLNRGFNGSIDEVRIWNRSLSAGEIYQQYVSSLQKIDSDQWYLYTNQSKNSTAGLDDGNYTYSVFVSDTPGNTNQTETRTYSIDNSPRVYLTCEAGGNYQQNALVLVNGRVTNRTSNISGANVNLSIFRLGVLNGTTNLTTVSDGSFSTDFAGLVVGSYILNGTVSTQSLTATCTDIFSVGGPASIIVDKIISLSSLANESASYNVTLNVINVGLSDSTGVILVDNDFNESPYDLGDIPANSSIIRSFIKSFERNSSTYEVNMSIASITATDSYSGDEINSNSSQVTIVVPSYEAQGLILVKNVYYNSENSTHVNYTISLDVINSGGEDLGSVVLIDSDLELSDTVSLLMGENYSYSSYVLIEKAASNTNKLFVRASAVANSVTYQSNQIQVRVPGYGGPADAIVNAPALVDASTDFDAVIQVLNMNPDIGQDFTIDYWITDKLEENNYSSGQKTIYVAASTQIDTNVSLTSPPSVGTYRLKVLVSWVGGTATAYDSFLVASIGSGINETENGSDEIEYHGGGTSTINLNNSRNDSISNGIVCNPPYIRYGVDCCLDVNLNKICDKDENTKDVTGLAVDSSEKDMIENNANRSFFGIITNQVKESSSRMFGVLEKITDNKNLLYIIIALLIVIVLLKMNIVGMVKNIVLFVAGFFARINLFGKKDSTHLTSLRGIKVYSSSGDYIGVVEEVYVETVSPRIYGYLLKLNKSIAKRIGKEKAIIKQGSIKSIGEVILLKIGSLDYSNDVESAERIVEEI